MTLLNGNREFFWEDEILCDTLALVNIFSQFYLREMRAESKIYSYIKFTGFTWWLQLYIERTEPPLNIAEVHPIYRSVMLSAWKLEKLEIVWKHSALGVSSQLSRQVTNKLL